MSVLKFTPREAAESMLKRYSKPEIAVEMAHLHACDYPEGDERRAYWEAVKVEMAKIKKGTP